MTQKLVFFLLVVNIFTTKIGLAKWKNDDMNYLTGLEKEVIEELNLARTNPNQYAKKIELFKKHYVGKYIYVAGQTQIATKEGVSAVNEAITYLNSQSPLPHLSVSKGLSLAARDHVKNQGPTGLTGHIGVDGSTPEERLNRFGKWGITFGENIEYGNFTATQIVMQLIIDDGVPARVHRDNIFNEKFRYIGVSCGPHQSYGQICVINFAGSFEETSE